MEDEFQNFEFPPRGLEANKKFWRSLHRQSTFKRIQKNFTALLAARKWIIVQMLNSVEIWSVEEDQSVTELDIDLVNSSFDLEGKWLEPDAAILEWVSFQFWMIKQVHDDELSDNGMNMKKWLRLLLP